MNPEVVPVRLLSEDSVGQDPILGRRLHGDHHAAFRCGGIAWQGHVEETLVAQPLEASGGQAQAPIRQWRQVGQRAAHEHVVGAGVAGLIVPDLPLEESEDLRAALDPLGVALVQLGVGGMIWTGIGYLIVNLVMGNIVEPRIMGKGLGLSTLVVFLSLIV